jgi:hypothetical protein
VIFLKFAVCWVSDSLSAGLSDSLAQTLALQGPVTQEER